MLALREGSSQVTMQALRLFFRSKLLNKHRNVVQVAALYCCILLRGLWKFALQISLALNLLIDIGWCTVFEALCHTNFPQFHFVEVKRFALMIDISRQGNPLT